MSAHFTISITAGPQTRHLIGSPVKQPGTGRKNGRFGVEEFFHLKAIQGAVS